MTRCIWLMGIVAMSLYVTPVAAQSRNGQSGGSNSSLFGTSGSGSTGGGSSNLGGGGNAGLTSALNSAFGGQGGLSGQGGGLGAQSGLGAQTGLNQQNQGFVGRNTNQNQFIGRTAQGQVNGQQGNQNRNRGGGGGNRSLDQSIMNGGNQAAGTSTMPAIRPRLIAAFDFPAANLSQVATKTQVLIDKLTARYPQMEQVQVSQADKGEILLTGSVNTERDAKLAESLVRLEPGVRKVQNQLTYPPPSPE